MLGPCFCARAFSSCGERGPLFIACAGLSLSRPLLLRSTGSRRRLSSCGSRALLLRGMWDLPRPVLEPVSPALAGRFSTTAPPGKPTNALFQAKRGSFGLNTQLQQTNFQLYHTLSLHPKCFQSCVMLCVCECMCVRVEEVLQRFQNIDALTFL